MTSPFFSNTTDTSDAGPANISIEQYHQLSDEYMDSIVAKLEELQEEREDVDVEYSVNFPIPHSLLVVVTDNNPRLVCLRSSSLRLAPMY